MTSLSCCKAHFIVVIVRHFQEHKFIEFPPKEIIDLLLSFVYIERYPLNFVRKIFNPYFLERMHNQVNLNNFLQRITNQGEKLGPLVKVKGVGSGPTATNVEII